MNCLKLHKSQKETTYKDILTHEVEHMIEFEIVKKINKGNLRAMQHDYNNNINGEKN